MSSLGAPILFVNEQTVSVRLTALAGIPMVKRGDNLLSIILSALKGSGEQLRDGDVLVIAQKIVVEGRRPARKPSGRDAVIEGRGACARGQ